MKVGHISADDMRNGQQAKETPVDGVPNTQTADEVQAKWLAARERRILRGDWRDFDRREDE